MNKIQAYWLTRTRAILPEPHNLSTRAGLRASPLLWAPSRHPKGYLADTVRHTGRPGDGNSIGGAITLRERESGGAEYAGGDPPRPGPEEAMNTTQSVERGALPPGFVCKACRYARELRDEQARSTADRLNPGDEHDAPWETLLHGCLEQIY